MVDRAHAALTDITVFPEELRTATSNDKRVRVGTLLGAGRGPPARRRPPRDQGP